MCMKDNPHFILTIGRQYGSGAMLIAKRLSERLGCMSYDEEIINLAAKESGFDEAFFKENDEQKNWIKTITNMQFPFLHDQHFCDNKISQENIFNIQSEVILQEAEKHSGIFVGRCADYVLREKENVVNIFLTADIDERVKMVKQRQNCDEDQALKIIQEKENNRATYYNYYTGKQWGSAENYDFCVNSSFWGLEGTTEMLEQIIRKKFDF